MRKKKNLPARMEKVSSRFVASPESRRGQWRGEFDSLALEIGCGKGQFIAGQAVRFPRTLFVGIDRVPEAVLLSLERAEQETLPNALFARGDAAHLPQWFAPGEAPRLYINFCDPWIPRKQAARRLVHRGFLTLFRDILAPGGEIFFKTDNEPLFDFALEEFPAAGYALTFVSRDWHGDPMYPGEDTETEYEHRFASEGLPIFRLTARKQEQ